VPGHGVVRERLDLPLRPADVLRALRDRPGLVGLVGAWCGGGALVACDPVEVLAPDADPFAAVAGAGQDAGDDLPLFGGGWIGLWGYQLGRRVERLPDPPPRPLPQPDHWLARYAWVLRQQPGQGWQFESLLPPYDAERELRRVRALLAVEAEPRAYRLGDFAMTPTPAGHRAAVSAALEHIAAGDIFQVNLCARLEAAFEGDPLEVFCRGLEALAPPYAAYLDTGERAVVSLSPELFLRRRGRQVLTSPIKGTVPITTDPHVLAASAKDRAENVMIVDLMRNDLGRVCEAGTVTVPGLGRVSALAGVWHLVSDVTGRLRPGVSDADLLRATFPPGSVTGAPKVRAMELTNELEATGRELYTGAIGYVSPQAGLEASVVIRTLEIADGRCWLGVGGGVVIDSTPAAELAECYAKAAPVLAAVGARLADPPAAAPSTPPSTPVAPAGVGLPQDLTAGERPDPAVGVFTTVLVHDGRPVLAPEHADRLAASAAALAPRPPDRDELLTRLREAAAATTGEVRLRVEVSGDGRVGTRARPLGGDRAAPWALTPVLLPGGLGAHKWSDRRLLDRLTAGLAEPGAEALLVDSDGTLLETARGCLFLVLDDGVHTPRADGRILPGIARASVLRLLERERIPVHERDLGPADLAAAAEVFVTNAVRGVVPVTSCAGVGGWPVGRTTGWLADLLLSEWPDERLEPRLEPRGGPPAPRARPGTRVLLVDNYDSFAYNLAQYAEELGAAVHVVRNDERPATDLVAAVARGDVTHVVLSPGPGGPHEAGVSTELVRLLGGRVPVLGVCLGHQCIAAAYGARVVRGRRPVHGKPALVHHDGRGIFAGVDGPLVAARYHSLVVEDLPAELEATAWTADGTLMGLRHRHHRVEGVQVHPESILTPLGHTLLGTFLDGRGPW
jgi:para-aminobenzoate synthetase/4-amino-4-deoxychorismate lyase